MEVIDELKKLSTDFDELDVEKEYKKTLEIKKPYEDNFFKNIVDYAKWMTAIALAALFWIASNLSGYHELPKQLLLSSLACILTSIGFSILIIFYVMGHWQKEYLYWYKATQYFSMLYAFKKGSKLFSTEEINQYFEDMMKGASKGILKGFPQFYNLFLYPLSFFLVLALILYLLAIIY